MRVQATTAQSLPASTRILHVDAPDLEALRNSVCGPLAWVASRRVTIAVGAWSVPHRGWSGRLGPLPGLLHHAVRLPRRSGPATVRVVLSEPVPFHLVAGAALAALAPGRGVASTVRADTACLGPLPSWLPPLWNVAGYPYDEEIIQPYDVLVGDGDPVTGAVPVTAEQLMVDATVANPIGLSIRDAQSVDGLAPLEVVRLAMTGAVLHASGPIAGLADELAAILAEPLSDVDDLALRSVRQRRAALRHHCTGFAFPAAVPSIPPRLRLPAVTAVTTHPELLAGQTYPALQVVEDLALARGSLVTAADTRFRYGPEHIWDLVLAYHYSGANVVGRGGGEETEVFTTSLSPGAVLVSRSEVTAAGGWWPERFTGPRYRTHAVGFERA